MFKYKLCVLLLLFIPASLFAQYDKPLETENLRIVEPKKASINLKHQSIDNEVEAPLPDDFQLLVEYRKTILVKHKNLEATLENLYLDLSYLPADIELLISERKILRDNDKKKIAELEKLEALDQQQSEYLQTLKDNVANDGPYILGLENQQKRSLGIQEDIKSTKFLIEKTSNQLVPVEQKIANMLNIEEERNSFRSLISIAFCVLVAIVIIGFYYIAIKKEEIAHSIFAGEKGIQFVTIFLIVIAIILFGIMGILEGKELSALLGGLSGYILGRVSGNSQNQVN
ncbi:hypothetical protein [uncultured Paraglaciecola sp.]|uniref:hypothetical protein n=1 Tax=uncultured Paraglaciecola sp. TaxID=1765024 RepID=UPI002596EB76|nr:hypothetical protein [uncultured Paraglaciecola sp.]